MSEASWRVALALGLSGIAAVLVMAGCRSGKKHKLCCLGR